MRASRNRYVRAVDSGNHVVRITAQHDYLAPFPRLVPDALNIIDCPTYGVHPIAPDQQTFAAVYLPPGEFVGQQLIMQLGVNNGNGFVMDGPDGLQIAHASGANIEQIALYPEWRYLTANLWTTNMTLVMVWCRVFWLDLGSFAAP